MPPKPGHLVLDASVAINLLGTTRGVDILRVIHSGCVMEARAAKEVTRHPRGISHPKGAIGELLEAGVLEVVTMDPAADYPIFVQLAGAPAPDGLDDGEAASLTWAVRHSGVLVVDEAKARRISKRDFPKLETRSSIDLFREWGQGVTAADLSTALKDARANARMRVLHQDKAWFEANTKT